ncbi:MAG: EAL domain-containing protein [Acidobacteria bacterium]|nr:EAL domain-containing protein [Acidobacteriota bacterium]
MIAELSPSAITRLSSEISVEAVLQSSPDGIAIIVRGGDAVFVNQSFAALFGELPSDQILWSLSKRFKAGDSFLVQMENSDGVSKEMELLDGRWMEVTAKPIRVEDGPDSTLLVLRDITSTVRALKENEIRERRLRDLLSTMSDGLVQTDVNEAIVFVNEPFCVMSGYSQQELIGKIATELFFEEEDSRMVSKTNRLRKKGISGQYETALKTKDGSRIHVIIGGTPTFDLEGEFSGTIGVFTDITGRKMAEEQLLHDALHDSLTGLANRSLFMEHLKLTIKSRKRGNKGLFAVLFFDFDRFKVVNDSLGHAAGDELLKQIAARFEANLRPGDLVARLGGDEFTILLNDLASEQAAFLLAERLQEDLKRPFDIQGREIFTSASIGISFGTASSTADELIRDADIAMYRAKSKGKSRFQLFDKEMHESAIKRLQLETELRQALKRKEFCLFYQPIVDINTRALSGFEALVRWNHPQKGFVPPDEFIPVLEENNLILTLGKWVFQEGCRQLMEWRRQIDGSDHLQMSINLSVKEFSQLNLIEQISETLAQTGVDPGSIKIEITESHVMENTGSAVSMMERLRGLGLELSLDDFGTGYSSLSYLHQLPVKFLKIDRSFIGRITENAEKREIVHTIVRLAQNLKMQVVAEGVETEEQLEELRRQGCEFGQGYLFSRPMDAVAASRYIEQSLSNDGSDRTKEIVAVRL